MYNRTNPAVIKSILFRLSKNELIVEIEYIRTQIIELEPGNKRSMFLRLYVFAMGQIPVTNQSCLKF